MSKGLFNNISNFHDYGIYLPNRSVTINGEIDGEKFEEVFNNLHMLDSTTGTINLFINNEGGEVTHGLAIYDAIKGCSNNVRGMVYGQACSMASYLLQACDERLMSPHSFLMIHEGITGIDGEMHPRIKEAWDKHEKLQDKQLQTIFMEKIKEKHPRYTKAKLDGLLVFDTILTPKQSIELGLADRIEDNFRVK
jgi:ATP-dependent Clp protease protease subunit